MGSKSYPTDLTLINTGVTVDHLSIGSNSSSPYLNHFQATADTDDTVNAVLETSPIEFKIQNYRTVGPVISPDYHLDLCDYAVYMASAKTNPILSDKHKMNFDKNLNGILKDDIDKDLSFTIKEEI